MFCPKKELYTIRIGRKHDERKYKNNNKKYKQDACETENEERGSTGERTKEKRR